MRGSPLVLGASLVLAACGGASAPRAEAPPARPSAPMTAATPEPPPLVFEYVVIHRRWVERLVPVQPSDVDAWSRAPENVAATTGALRHILFEVPGGEKEPGLAAKKKAEAALERLNKGEDFTRLARQLERDPSAKDSGGELTGEQAKDLGSAFELLAPGETAAAPVRSPRGWHVIRKDRASDERIEAAYRKAKAPELAKRLADDLLARLRSGAPTRAAIADAVLAVLGERGVNDANRPTPSIVDRERLKQVRLPAAAKAALETFAQGAHAGDALPSPAVDADTLLVARARAASDG